MIEALIERAMHTALCRTLERSLQETGLPPDMAQELYSRLLAHAQGDKEQADAAAAAALGVEDEDDLVHSPTQQSLPSEVPMAATTEEGSGAETPTVVELVAWLIPALEDGATWAGIAQGAGPGQDSDRL